MGRKADCLPMDHSLAQDINPRLSTRPWLTALFLGLFSLAFFLWGIRNPNQPVYDEAQYLSSARALLTEAENPNPEAPPLGKLLVAASMRLLGDNPLGWRVASALFGSLSLVGAFVWVLLLLDDFGLALTAAVLTLLNNFLFVFSRVAMMDVFLIAFVLWGLTGFTAALKVDSLGVVLRRALLAFSGIMLGFACACKWNGVDTLGIVITTGAVLFCLPARSSNPEIQLYAGRLRQAGVAWFSLSFLALPILAYCVTFWPLLRSLHRPFSFSELAAMNIFIWRFHLVVVGNPPITSAWYTWPLQRSPQRALSYLVGNWYVMWGGLLALFFCLRRFLTALPETLIALLYIGNLLQWAVTPQSCLYYYYYYPAAVFAGLAIPVALNRLPERVFGIRLILIAVLPAICVFAYCYPRMANLPPPFDCALGCWP